MRSGRYGAGARRLAALRHARCERGARRSNVNRLKIFNASASVTTPSAASCRAALPPHCRCRAVKGARYSAAGRRGAADPQALRGVLQQPLRCNSVGRRQVRTPRQRAAAFIFIVTEPAKGQDQQAAVPGDRAAAGVVAAQAAVSAAQQMQRFPPSHRRPTPSDHCHYFSPFAIFLLSIDFLSRRARGAIRHFIFSLLIAFISLSPAFIFFIELHAALFRLSFDIFALIASIFDFTLSPPRQPPLCHAPDGALAH